MKIFRLLLAFSFSFVPLANTFAAKPEVSDYSDLVLEDNELNLIEKPTFSIEYFYEANHLFYDLSGIEGSYSLPITQKLSLIGHLGVVSTLNTKKLLDYYLAQDPQFHVENFYPKPSSFMALGFEYQLLSSRVNFFNRSALPLAFNIQAAGISEFYTHSAQKYFMSIAGVLRLKIQESWGFYFRAQSASGNQPIENRSTYFIGPYGIL